MDVDRAEADRHDYNTSVQINLHPDLQQIFPVRRDNIQDTEEEEEGGGRRRSHQEVPTLVN